MEYLLVGASTVQVTTGIIRYGYGIVEDMIEGCTDFLKARGISRLRNIIGQALPNLVETDHFDLTKQGIANYDLDKCVGCGQCYVVCHDSGGQALKWDSERRRPQLAEEKCLSCMVCSFVCPVQGLISFKPMPPSYRRQETLTLGQELE
jgi:dihydropyrimidine dehydrogenase (NAD+) subunit PreA